LYEVHLATEAYEDLLKKGIHTRVVSVPSLETFLAQDKTYRDNVLPPETQNRVVIEAASAFGWHALAPQGEFLCMEGFGASAPAPELYEHFGITTENAVNTMTRNIK
jgi:transketolase